MEQKSTLLALCASHVNSVKRVDAIEKMLASVAVQEEPAATNFYMRVTYGIEDKDQLIACRKRIRKAVKKIPGGEIFEHTGRCMQFEHYKLLVAKLEAENKIPANAWLIFTDDDDPWHPARSSLYRKWIQEMKDTKALRLHAGGLTQEQANVDGNYWEYALEAGFFGGFVKKISAAMAAHRFCDVFLLSYIRSAGGELCFLDEYHSLFVQHANTWESRSRAS